MRYLTLSQVLELHRRIIDQSGGTLEILDLRLLESALQQPRMVFAGKELYPSLAEKASILGFNYYSPSPFH